MVEGVLPYTNLCSCTSLPLTAQIEVSVIVDCDDAASWSSTSVAAAVTVAADCNSGKTSVTMSSHGTAAPVPSMAPVPSVAPVPSMGTIPGAPVPSIGIIPSSPDVTNTHVTGAGAQLLQPSTVQDDRTEMSDTQVCTSCTCC